MTPKSQDCDAALLTAILNASVNDAIVVTDAKGIILRIIARTAAMFGYHAKDLLGKSINILIPEPYNRLHDEYLQHYLKTGITHVIGKGREIEGLHANGDRIPLAISIGTAKLKGEVIFVAVMQDISQLRKAQAALARLRHTESVGRLTGGFAHDFNNLLAVITGNLELLADKIKDPSQLEMLQDALAAAEIGADLTETLLVFARRGNLLPQRLDINTEVRRAIKLMRRTLGEKIVLQTQFATDLWPVSADPVQLQTALLNLAVNARDAMPNGGHLTFQTNNIAVTQPDMAQEHGLSLGHYVQILVSDTGAGMAAEALEHAFDPFFTTKRPGKGTGLGLSMVYGFVQQSGGQAHLASKPGKGTTVKLFFPAAEGGIDETTDTPVKETEQIAPATHTVLVVEDDERLRRLTTTRIKALGYNVVTAADSNKALELLANGPIPDLVFTDLLMPGTMSGHELALHVQKNWPHIPVLLTSGDAVEISQKSNDFNSFKLLPKPYRQAELSAQLAALLKPLAR